MEELKNNILKEFLKNKTFPYPFHFDNEDYIILPESQYKAMQDTIKNKDDTIINYIIEKEIAKAMPKDFDDVYIVVKNIIKEIKKENLTSSDIKEIIKEIKINYPNLFINIEDYFKEINAMEIND